MLLPYELLEPAAAANLLDWVDAYKSVDPSLRAEAIPCAGGVAAFVGAESPISSVKGAGPVLEEAEILKAEEFLRARGVPRCVFELAPWFDAASAQRLEALGYELAGRENVVYRQVSGDKLPPKHQVETAPAEPWGEVLRVAFEAGDSPVWRTLSSAAAGINGAQSLGIRDDSGAWAACAQILPAGTVALFACDGTLPEARGRGYQTSLISERLRIASELGFLHAVAEVAPGGGSERNYLHCGFQVVYARSFYAKAL